jgi:hypothetical protein
MTRFSLLLSASLSLLLASAIGPQARAQQTPDASIVTTPAKSDTAEQTKQAINYWSRILILGGNSGLLDKQVSVGEKDAKFKDVLKKLLDQVQVDYTFEHDTPDDARITVELRNVPIVTALDAVTASVGLNWYGESHDGKIVVHIRKKLDMGTSRGYKSMLTIPNTTTPFNADTYLRMLPSLGSAQAYTVRSRETRSTFTCPNCHNQVTIIRKNVAPKCTTCGRPFEPDWKVCPFDGTKRPEAKDDWKFCPICGKPIPDGTLSYTLQSGGDKALSHLYEAPVSFYKELALPAAVSGTDSSGR